MSKNSGHEKAPVLAGAEALDNVNRSRKNVMANNSTNVVPFNFGKHQVRTLLIAGEPWFAAQDVLDSLEYAETYKPSRAMSHVPDAWKGVHRLHTPGGIQQTLMISEQGLYFVLGRSDKPKALPFQMWLAGDVLPAIRKTGAYFDHHNAMGDLVGAVIGSSGEVVLDRVIDQKAIALPASLRRSYRHTMKSRLRSRFNVQRTALIPAECLSDACNFVAAYVIEGEFLGKEKPNGLSMSLQDWVDACPVTRHAQAGQPVGRVILTGALCADMDTVKPLQRLINELAKQGVDVSAYDAHYHFLLEYLRENRRFLRDAQRLMEKASENEFAFRTRVAA